jgi:hypothetical protein
MFLAVPSIKIAVFCNKTPCNKLHGVIFQKRVTRGTKNGPDGYSDLLRCNAVGWHKATFRTKRKQYKRQVHG